MKAYLTTNRDRLSKRYKALHRQLAAEVAQSKLPEPDKVERRKQRSAEYRQRGGE